MSTASGTSGDLRDRGTGELVRTLSDQVSTLVRQEVALAKAELAEKGRKAGLGAGMLAGAALAGLLMLGALTASLIIALALALPAWAAAVIVTGFWGAVAGLLALEGRNKLRAMGKPIPEKTVETVKEDVQWLKDRT
ncbi:MAG TPA: phage holin family protein [Gaiellaceae bacterium]|nr:phage holin family protein [Gaiellaceae bacterium]